MLLNWDFLQQRCPERLKELTANSALRGCTLLQLYGVSQLHKLKGASLQTRRRMLFKPVMPHALQRALAPIVKEPGPEAPAQTNAEYPSRPLTVAAQRTQTLEDATAAEVLLVEDSPINQEVTEQFLKKGGYCVTIAASGPAALEALSSRAFACVLMDCQLPGMDGYETTRRLRAGEAGTTNQSVPIIAVTANAMEGEAERCKAAGMSAFLPKPFSMEALIQAVVEHTRNAPNQRPHSHAVSTGPVED